MRPTQAIHPTDRPVLGASPVAATVGARRGAAGLARAKARCDNAGMSPTPRLVTDRLVLRGQKAEDAAVYRRLWTERDPRVPAHRRIDAAGRPSVADIAERIRLQAGSSALLGVVRKDPGDLIGYCGLVFDDQGAPGEPQLAFELLRAAHDLGYATESARAVVAWADEIGHPRLWATVWDWNAPSRRVLEKLGFRETGQVTGRSAYGRSILTVRDPGA
jgi:RimJ/RimL family protein N-acetyltransferase